jgi:hypothetical protein
MEELRRAGRNDLRYALQTHGSRKVATLLGLKMQRRGCGCAPEFIHKLHLYST